MTQRGKTEPAETGAGGGEAPEPRDEALIDEAEKESFPASDPPESYRVD